MQNFDVFFINKIKSLHNSIISFQKTTYVVKYTRVIELYKNYIFDLYGTLIDIRTDEEDFNLWNKIALLYCYRQAEYTGRQLKEKYIEYVRLEKDKVRRENPQYEYIDIQIERVFRRLFEDKGVKVDESYVHTVCTAFRCYSTKHIELYDGVIDLLETLKAREKKIYLLSNAQQIFTENELNMFGLPHYFDGILISSDVQCSKPDINFYNKIINRFNLDKRQTIMIGNDWICDIQGSRKAGLNNLYIHQSISPEIKGELKANYKVMDGDVYKIKNLLIKE